jgi:3-hydroxyacyl-CoA dehydrogenase
MRKYIAVIGTGIMASGIAAGFIAKSIPVVILGRNKEKSDACLDKVITLAGGHHARFFFAKKSAEINSKDCRIKLIDLIGT